MITEKAKEKSTNERFSVNESIFEAEIFGGLKTVVIAIAHVMIYLPYLARCFVVLK